MDVNEYVVIMQVRTSSSRLPSKALLPIGGMPMALLAALRAKNKGAHLIAATSDCESDDALVNLLAMNGVSVYRGDLENVLKRCTCALNGYDNKTIVVRLTADNVFPDGALIKEVVKEFIEKKIPYLQCGGPNSGLPYGVSVEVTRYQYIKESLANVVTKDDCEHVTAYIRRKYGVREFTPYSYMNQNDLRATIDFKKDFIRVQKVFKGVPNPVEIGFKELTARLFSLK